MMCGLMCNQACVLPLLELSAELLQDFTRLPVVFYSRVDQCRQLAHLLHLLATTPMHGHKQTRTNLAPSKATKLWIIGNLEHYTL